MLFIWHQVILNTFNAYYIFLYDTLSSPQNKSFSTFSFIFNGPRETILGPFMKNC
jgi:hypothetical protein